MIRGDGDGGPGKGDDGAGREDGAKARVAVCPAPPAAAVWHPATATATVARAAARRPPFRAVLNRRDSDRLIMTSSRTMATANAPPRQGPKPWPPQASRVGEG